MFPPQGGMNGFNGSPQMNNNNMNGGTTGNGRGRGSGRGRGMGRGRGHAPSSSIPSSSEASTSNAAAPSQALKIVAPTPTTATAPINPSSSATSVLSSASTTQSQQRSGFVLPERPQSPTLCKFGLKCTNAHCRYSHPSPVATAESGVVLSNEACDKGKDCKDKDCIKAHVSPAVLNPQGKSLFSFFSIPSKLTLYPAAEQPPPNSTPQLTNGASSHNNLSNGGSQIPCRFGIACTRSNCSFAHPPRPQTNHFAQQCRFGAGCTRATCPFQHPEGRVLPSTFHRGLSNSAPLVNVQTPEAGSMGGPSPHRSVTFNSPSSGLGVKAKLEQQMKEIEEKKSQAEKAVKDAEAAASKKEESKPVAIAA